MRWCHNVIKEMLQHIPINEDNAKFISDLEWNIEDSLYKAPEQTIQWVRTAQTLEKHIPNPKEDWEFEVISIFTTNPVEQVRKEVKEHLGE